MLVRATSGRQTATNCVIDNREQKEYYKIMGRHWKNLKLQWKIALTMLIILLINLVLFLLLYRSTWNTYEYYLRTEMANRISRSVMDIETEMRVVEDTLSKIATSNAFQQNVRRAENAKSDYDQYRYRQALLSQVKENVSRIPYILSIHYVDTQKKNTSSGFDNTSRSLFKDLETLYALALDGSGSPVWVVDGDTFVLMCEIREIKDLSLRTMGVLAFRISIPQMVTLQFTKTLASENLLIFENGDLIYSTASFVAEDICETLGSESFGIVSLNGTETFLAHKHSDYFGYDYYVMIGYDDLFGPLRETRELTIGIYILIVAMMIPCMVALTNSIAGPLRELIKVIKSTSSTPPEQWKNYELSTDRKDEVGIISKAYGEMLSDMKMVIEKNYERQILLRDTQLKALQTQINPHFLYNTLDSIYWMAENADQPTIAQMTFALGRILRTSIQMSKDDLHMIPLREELKLLSYYIMIQKERFGDALQVREQISDNAWDWPIPQLTLQPLVENAINFTVETKKEPADIWIRAFVREGVLTLRIEDNGIAVVDGLLSRLERGEIKPRGTGVGLRNIYRRFQILFADRFSMDIRKNEMGGTTVEIRIQQVDGEE